MLVLAALCLAGCTTPHFDWYGDERFTTNERSAIEAGEAWLAMHAGREPASFAWDYKVTSEERLPHTIRRERGPSGDMGTTGACVGATVFMDPDDPNAAPNSLDGLAAHEMAHCELGFVDDIESDGIMHVLVPKRWTNREDAQLHHTTVASGPQK